MRSKRYKAMASKIDRAKSYAIDEAIKLTKETAKVKFDPSMEAHIHLGIDTKKSEQSVRGNIVLPHGTGKVLKMAVFTEDEKTAKAAGADIFGGEEIIKEIKASGKADFQIALATPTMMKTLSGVAKILGPKGLMPSPKAGTVVEAGKMAAAIAEIKRGKVTFKNDDTGNIHQLLGKVSWEDKVIKENFEVFIEAVRRAKPSSAKGVYIQAVYLTSSMGPSVRVAI